MLVSFKVNLKLESSLKMGSFFGTIYYMDNELPLVRKAITLFNGRGKTAIDLGCGYGRNSFFLAKNGFELVAVDKHQECLNKIKEKDVDNKIKTINADLVDFKFPQNFDFILCTFVLHYFKKDISKKIIIDAINHLNHKGILVVALIKNQNGLSFEELEKSVKDLSTLSCIRKIIHDEPHPGAQYPHEHEVLFYIGEKF